MKGRYLGSEREVLIDNLVLIPNQLADSDIVLRDRSIRVSSLVSKVRHL